MAVYVDKLREYRSGKWCHMMADTEEELHQMAKDIGLKEEWFQGDHYDLKPRKREWAITLGAVEVPSQVLVGLRQKNWTAKAEK